MTLTRADADAPPLLYPPRVSPPARALPLWRFLPTFLRNPLRTVPRPVFEEPFYVPAPMRGRLVWITDPKLIERVLLDEHAELPKSPVERRIFGRILGDSILTAEGQSWRWQRRTVAPLFRPADLQALVPDMAAAAQRTIEIWRHNSSARPRPIDRDMTDATFDVLEATLFSGSTAAEALILKTEIGRYLEHTSWDIAYEILGLPTSTWHPRQRSMQRSADLLLDAIGGLTARQRNAGWSAGGLLAKLGQARDPETGELMSDALVSHNLLTFAAAGHETTAKALTWTLYLLARAPEWQQRVFDEVGAVAGDDAIEAAHYEQLTITRQVLKEAMRLYPPAPIVGRMSRKPIDIGGHLLPAGVMLVIPIYAVHRHRALWSDPDAFNPTRFAPDAEKALQRGQYMPFGFGPRTCVGMSFAMLEGVVLLAEFVRAARFSCDATLAPEPVSRVTLRPRGGMPLRVDMR